MNHSIRLAAAADVAAYRAFIAALFAEHLDTLVAPADAPPIEQVESYLAAHAGQRSALFLAEVDGQILGTANLTRFARPPLEHALALGLNVAAGARNQGIGRSLLAHGLRWAASAGVERVELEVLANNLAAIHLYQAFGFVREGVKRRAVKRDGGYIDIHIYGLLLPTGAAP